MTKILIVDDDIEFTSLLAEYLEEDDFSVLPVDDWRRGLELARSDEVSVVLLDIMMPGINGIELLKRIRRQSDVPVIMLTAKGDDSDRIAGLDFGADDYVTKPCSPGEIAARLRAILRRVAHGEPHREAIIVGDLTIDAANRTAVWRGQPLGLTGLEFSILELLAQNAGQLLSRDFISRTIFGVPAEPYDRRVDVHVSSVRRKLGIQPDGRPWIESSRGQGYQLRRATK